MNPKVKTVLLGLVSLAILGATQLAPATAPAWIHAIGSILVAVFLIVNLLHAPASVVEVIQTLLAAVTQPPPANSLDETHPAVVRARKVLRRATSLLPLVVLLYVVAPIGGGTLEAGCTPPPSTPNVINTGATCADDIVEDVQQPPTQALLAQTLIDCGLTALALYQAIQELIANASGDASAPDGGALVSTRRRGAVPRELYLAHLHKWSDLAAAAVDGGAR